MVQLKMFIIGLLIGGAIGFILAAGNGITFDGHNHDHHQETAQEIS